MKSVRQAVNQNIGSDECRALPTSQIIKNIIADRLGIDTCVLCLCGESLMLLSGDVVLKDAHTDTRMTLRDLKNELQIVTPAVELDEEVSSQQKICLNCVNSLSYFYFFSKKCLKANIAVKNLSYVLKEREKSSITKPAKTKIYENLHFEDIYRYADMKIGSTLKEQSAARSKKRNVKQQGAENEADDYPSTSSISGYKKKRGTPKLRHCNKCEYATPFPSCLQSHINRVHLRTRPFKCDVCGKGFYAELTLKEHALTHSGEKPEQCDQCGKRFVCKKTLRLHSRIHSGEKPYPCDLCEESFLSSSRRQEHRTRKHFEPTIQCPLCSKMYYTSSALRSHIKKCHSQRQHAPDNCNVVLNM